MNKNILIFFTFKKDVYRVRHQNPNKFQFKFLSILPPPNITLDD